eukprot:TRINITY_DN5099_c0_g2_i2.p1 TRINITY_DN5099_c0_g2~~TRINITY_DN5099_c0_g2_i2.p1  ORF type:complete len:3332 (+),score=752.58 TRINITY_DN5099_c0_g2_i2:2916-12911(+)
MAAIRTSLGPVDLREKRNAVKLRLGQQGEVEIKKQWLKGKGDMEYKKAVMQAMTLADQRIKIFDSADPNTTISADVLAAAKSREVAIREGKEAGQTPVKKDRGKLSTVQRLDQRERNLLVKFSNKCCLASANRRERYFVIENGEILVFKSNAERAKMKMTYNMRQAEVFMEKREMAPYPIWEKNYNVRLRVDAKERSLQHKTPVYLYADQQKLNRWKRAFNLAKLLTAETDRRALKVCVGRATSASLNKGWEAMVSYFKELKQTKAMVKTVAMRLMKVELNRGYSKMRLVYRSHAEREKLRYEQRLWAARFMSEKMARFSNQKAKSARDVRDIVVSAVQRKFRRYRNDAIFDRTYPLSASMTSKLTQAKLGTSADICMRSLLGTDVMMLSLDSETQKTFKEMPELFGTKKATYSEVNIPVSSMHVFVPENLSSLSFTSAVQDGEEDHALTKVNWSNFINFDRISSVILHSDPAPGAVTCRKDGVPDAGVWFSINGPRLAWGKTMKVDASGRNREVVGVADGFEVAEKLARASAMKWAQVKVKFDDAQLKRSKDLVASTSRSRGDEPNSPGSTVASGHRKLMLVSHILGYAHKSPVKEAEGDAVSFDFALEAGVPMPQDEAALVSVEKSEFGVEIYEVFDDGVNELLFVGSAKLSQVFKAEGSAFQAAFSDELGVFYDLPLRPAFASLDTKTDAKISVSIKAEVGVPANTVPDFLGDNKAPVSPEFVGMGQMTSLYTSHRGVWYDANLGAGKFRSDHVANYVEISLASLRFPKTDTGNEGSKYKIRASIGPACVNSVYLTRPKNGWSRIIGTYGDTSVIKFDGARMCLPLPPGCFSQAKKENGENEVPETRQKILIQVWKVEPEPLKPMTYAEYVQSSGRSKANKKETLEYQANVSLGNTAVDVVRTVSVYFSAAKTRNKPDVDLFTNMIKPGTDKDVTECCLTSEITLRDWDYAKASTGQQSAKRALCVGDKAMLVVEEPLLYPANQDEFRKRFIDGKWNEKDAKTAANNGGAWPKGRFPLRNPVLSSEYAASGLIDAVPKVPFKQGFIPNFCDDIVPHKFLMPLTEKVFLDQNQPGTFASIMDDLVDNPPKQIMGRANSRPIVTHLTKINQKISVTLLATYADGTCDVELEPDFLQKWAKAPNRKYSMPGQLQYDRTSANASKPGRALVKRVPMMYVQAVHSAGFHIYDALFHKSADVIAAKAPESGFDPRTCKDGNIAEGTQRGSFCLAAGPMPPDVSNASCEYEWTVRMRAADEFEMHSFVAMLRRCNRLDNFQQATKMLEYRRRAEQEGATQQQQQMGNRPRFGGQLDVLLVEARRLVPTKEVMGKNMRTAATLLDRPELKLNEAYLPQLKGTTAGEAAKSTPEGNSMISTFVNFRMLCKQDAIAFRGQKVQASLMIEGTDSPSWAAHEALVGKGGHLFQTGIIDPEKYPDLVIDFEVMQYGPVPGMTTRIGAIQLPVTHRQFLTNPADPFKNLWLPLLSYKEGNLVANATGEIHLMCRWTPVDKIPVNPSMQLNSVKSQFLKEIWPRVVAQRLREPIYGLEVQYLRYNPNLVRGDQIPESPKDHIRRHAEELCSAVPYLAALERRQAKAWEDFEASLSEDPVASKDASASLAELRQAWTRGDQDDRLSALQTLIHAGIPSARRPKFWADITLASSVMEKEGAGKPTAGTTDRMRKAADAEYQQLLAKGLPLACDAMLQLQEDAFHMSHWETSVPPVPEFTELHLKRIRRAQNVVTALLACDGGVVYCEGLLIVAFFLLLPQGCKEEKIGTDEDSTLTYMSESQVFWLLYTLVCSNMNGTYREYYGQIQSSSAQGVIADVALLDCCVSYYEPKVWQHFDALGFQLATVFSGCFYRLYATYMPTSTVFRFWDALFAHTTDSKAHPHGRAHLINLAFALLRAKRADILLCESALEVKDLILGALGSIYDMSTVIDLVNMADTFLWGGSGFSSSKVAAMWDARETAFQVVNYQAEQQSNVLREVVQKAALGFIPSTKYKDDQRGLTTRVLMKEVIPVLNTAFEARSAGKGTGEFWFMHRQMPLVSKMQIESFADQMRSYMLKASSTTGTRPEHPRLISPLPCNNGKIPPCLEPPQVGNNDFLNIIRQHVPNWGPKAEEIFQLFCNRGIATNLLGGQASDYGAENMHQLDVAEEGLFSKAVRAVFGGEAEAAAKFAEEPQELVQLSLNELYASMICMCRGTVGEKAAALFSIFSTSEPGMSSNLYHMQPVSKLAQAITRAADFSGVVDKSGAPPHPDDPDAKSNALRLVIMSDYPKKGTVVGWCYVPALGPYVNYSAHEPEAQHFNVWVDLDDKARAQRAVSSSAPTVHEHNEKKSVCIGDLEMSIMWTPKSIKEPELGQLMLRVHGIWFSRQYVTDAAKLNPWISVHTVRRKENGTAEFISIDRWDPRGLIGREGQKSWLTTHGAYGGNIHFDQTMRDGTFTQQGDSFRSYYRDGNQGWIRDKVRNMGKWTWNEVWGKQMSVEDFRMEKEFVTLMGGKNVMDLQGVRLLVSTMLRRSALSYTNRQMIMIADDAFNRMGAVPGILEAVLVDKDDKTSGCRSMKELKDTCSKHGLKFADVTQAVVLEHEREIKENGGYLNLFREQYLQRRPVNIHSDMGIKNLSTLSFNSRKELWIRYVRGGDGERCLRSVDVEAHGNIPIQGSEVPMELLGSQPQTKVTKEEFVSCVLASPLLSESLRRQASQEQRATARKAVAMDVTIMDPRSEEQDAALMDAINVGQSLLFEVWDADVTRKDFLGEAWLPPLSTFNERPRDVILPLQAADFSEDAENGPSHGDEAAKQVRGAMDENKKIKGDLHCTISWKFPAYEVPEGEGGGESMHERALVQEKLHTGKLTIKINRATNLRRADAKLGKNADPQVTVWVRNDFAGKWRNRFLLRTKYVSNTLNPKFNYEKSDILLQTGEYEDRFPPAEDGFFSDVKKAFRTQRTANKLQDQRDILAVKKRFGDEGLKIKFYGEGVERPAAANLQLGDRHMQQVYLSDSIREFKAKLTHACAEEAQEWIKKGERVDEAEQYKDINIGYKHLVMVFVPSAKVQRLYSQNLQNSEEYRRAHEQALNDPSCWQPLSPARTFQQYPWYGFGRSQAWAHSIRVVEATESYKVTNLRYKEFDRDLNVKGYEDRDTKDEAYGWAKYVHAKDLQAAEGQLSTEWRPCFASTSSSSEAGPKANAAAADSFAARNYQVKWLFPPEGLRRQADGKPEPELREKSMVLLKPRMPQFDNFVHPMHEAILDEARVLRRAGKSDFDIETILKKQLEEEYRAAVEARAQADARAAAEGRPASPEIPKPPPITVDIIRAYLLRAELDATLTKAKAA